MRIPTVLGTRYFQDRSQCHISFRRSQKPPEMIFDLVYTKMNRNSRKKCEYSPSWAQDIFGTEADVIFVFGGLKKPQK